MASSLTMVMDGSATISTPGPPGGVWVHSSFLFTLETDPNAPVHF